VTRLSRTSITWIVLSNRPRRTSQGRTRARQPPALDVIDLRWRKTFLVEVREKLAQLGLMNCAVCESEHLTVHRFPFLALMGNLPPNVSNLDDAEMIVEYLVRVECGICGYVMLFSAERFRTGDDETLVRGMTEQEEDELERRHPL
jgi:hypothetical protein